MSFTNILWLLVWGGMFSGIYNLKLAGALSDPMSVFQGARALFPLVAAYLCLMWMLVKKPGFSFFRMPAGLLFGYFAIGAVSSVFLSPNRMTALYWAGEYLAPLLVVWVAIEMPEPLDQLRRILYLNNIIVTVIFFALIPDVLRVGGSDERFSQFYVLPFGLGEMRANGVGRFALVTIIIASAYILSCRRKRDKIIWGVVLLPALFMLAQTRSRTSLLGLAISGVLLVLILGADLRFLIIAPAATYLVYLSGIKWRLQGHVERLMFLTGRDYTWRKGLAQIEHSPFLGWGFHADRIMLNSEHMHNSYLHSAIHGGLFGASFFLAAIVAIWVFILRSGIIKRVRGISGRDLPLLIQSILIIGFLTGRSFFESTAAFYGVDLLLLVPAMAFLWVWSWENAGGVEARPVMDPK
jgi:O-antigen ligase